MDMRKCFGGPFDTNRCKKYRSVDHRSKSSVKMELGRLIHVIIDVVREKILS